MAKYEKVEFDADWAKLIETPAMPEYVPDAPLDQVLDGPCCEWFAPPTEQIARGARQTRHWKFTRAQAFPACTNRTRNRHGELSCPYAQLDAPRLCDHFVADPIEVIAQVVVGASVYRLECQRQHTGVPRYMMRIHAANEFGVSIQMAWSIDGDDKLTEAMSQFRSSIVELGESPDDIVAPQAAEPESFFAKLVS